MTKVCRVCDREFSVSGRANHKVFCTVECRTEYYKRRSAYATFPGISSSTIGAMAELLTCYDLMSKGWEVFRAMSPACPCDLIAMKGSLLIRVQVRSTYKFDSGETRIPTSAKDEGRQDMFAVVVHNDKHIEYSPPLPVVG